MSTIAEVDIVPFTFDVENLSQAADKATGASHTIFAKGETRRVMRYAVAIRTDDGLEGALRHALGRLAIRTRPDGHARAATAGTKPRTP